MSSIPIDDQLEIPPFWTVQVVFDPDGTGHDFAYTMGLHDRGLPELHLYARPSLGSDPGADWKFSTRDCCSILNEFAAMLVRGTLEVGSTVTQEYDGGLAVVEFRVDPPGDKDELEAYGTHPEAPVLPLRWSLTRAPEGPAQPVASEVAQRARQRYLELLDGVATGMEGAVTGMALPSGWQLPEEPCFDPLQRFGPMTPLVLARAAQFWRADAATLKTFAVMAATVDDVATMSWPVVRARGLGRPAGRSRALDAVEDALDRLLWDERHDPWARRRLPQVVDSFVASLPRDLRESAARAQAEQNVRQCLHLGMLACLSGEVVADLADQELRLWSAGLWQAVSSPNGRPGTEWYASDAVLGRVRAMLAPLSVTQLLTLGTSHVELVLADSDDDPESREARYARLRSRLTSWALVSASGCPPARELVADPHLRIQLAVQCALAGADEWNPVHGLDDWLECVTSLLVHRPRLRADASQCFAEPFRDVLPGLARMLDEPV